MPTAGSRSCGLTTHAINESVEKVRTMPKHKDATPNSADHSYEVGYGKPTTHGRFRPGQSGNPAGRPKGLNNLRTDVKRSLEIPVRVQEVGRSRRISTQRGALLRLREKGLQGDD